MENDEYPLVSIIVPSFNQGDFIGDTLQSIVKQDYKNLEIIVMDGGSTDDTKAKVLEFSNRISFFSEKDNGQSDAINKGFMKSKGDIIAWLNSDDIYLFENTISSAVRAFQEQPEIDVLFGDYLRIDEKNRFLRANRVWRTLDLHRLSRMCYISQPTVFFRAGSVKGNLLDVSLHYGMDLELWLRLGSAGLNFSHSGRFVAAERIHGNAKTVANPEKSLQEATYVRRKYVSDPKIVVSRRNMSDKAGLVCFRLRALFSALSIAFKKNTIIKIDYGGLIAVMTRQLSRHLSFSTNDRR